MIAYFLGNGVGTEGTGIGLLLKGGMTGTQGYGSKEQVETARGAAGGGGTSPTLLEESVLPGAIPLAKPLASSQGGPSSLLDSRTSEGQRCLLLPPKALGPNPSGGGAGRSCAFSPAQTPRLASLGQKATWGWGLARHLEGNGRLGRGELPGKGVCAEGFSPQAPVGVGTNVGDTNICSHQGSLSAWSWLSQS